MTVEEKAEENCNCCVKMCFDMPLRARANCKERVTVQDLYDKISKLKKETEELKEKLETIKELVINYDMHRYNKDNFINKVMQVLQ